MKLPSLIRAASVAGLKLAVMAPVTLAKRTTPDPLRHMKIQVEPKNVILPQTPKPPDPTKPPPIGKVAGWDTLARTGMMFADDAVEIGLRKALQTGTSASAVPVMADRIKQINDPSYQPDPQALALRRSLSILNKFSSASGGQPGMVMGYTPSKPTWQLDPTARSHFGFDAQGPAQKNTMNPEPNIGTGDFPKMGGDGNAQGYGAVENRGGTNDHASQMHSQDRALPATGALTTSDATSSAFSRLRAYMKTDTASFSEARPEAIG